MNEQIPTPWKKIALIAIIIALAIAFKLLHLSQYMSLAYLKASRAHFQALYAQRPWLVAGLYFLIYVTAIGLSLPGAGILTLAGGALFGLILGTVLVSFASTIGATIGCFVSRFVLRDWVRRKFGRRLEPIDRGIEREGPFYLVSLRLVPVFPFFMINLAMGLTRMRLWTYYWVSQLSMLPATIVYVNAGKQLATIQTLADVASPRLLGSLAILGVLPLASKKVLDRVRSRYSVAGAEETK